MNEEEKKLNLESEVKVSEEPVRDADVEIKEEVKQEPEFVEIYTDGACSGNPGPGGFAAVLLWGGEQREVVGGERFTTNNKMEILAAINGLKALTRTDVKIKLYTDSLYLQKGITEWIEGWKKKNFKDVKNVELWKELDSISSKLNIEWYWVKAHAGNKYNEIADELARGQSLMQK